MIAPLSKLSVLELGKDVAVRYCGRLLANLGAEVLAPGAPEDGAIGRGGEAGRAYGRWLDQGKRRKAAREGAQARLDLIIAGQDAEAITAAQEVQAAGERPPPLLALTWFDPEGPYRSWRGGDAVIEAMTGLAFGFGAPEGPPILAQGHGPQLVAGLTGFIAALAALMSDPTPARVDVNVLEAALCFADPGAVIGAASGLPSARLGPNRFSPTYPCSIYRSADGHVGVTALTPAQWTSLAGLIGRQELGREPRFATTLSRLAHAEEIDRLLAPAFAEATTGEWVKRATALRIPITPVPRPGEAPDVPHWRGRGAFAPLEDGVRAPALPFRMGWDGVTAPRPRGDPCAPLAGVRVADFSMGWAGPLAGRLLADLGADVLKIESSVRPDWWRGWEAAAPSEPAAGEMHLNFLAVNRGKRGLDLDLTTPADQQKASAVIAACDVVIENLGPGVMERLDLGPRRQRALRPGVISIAMPPFGRTGPLAGLRAYGSTVEQASGMPFVNGLAHWPPCLQHVAYGDPVAGLYATAVALAALFARDRLGGADIEVCQVECLFQFVADAVIGEQVLRRPSPRTGSRRPTASPCCVVACAGVEAWLAVVVEDAEGWRGLCDVLERKDWRGNPGFAEVEGREAAGGAIEAAIAAWAADKPVAQAAGELQGAGVAAGPVTATHALARDPQLSARGHFAVQRRRFVGEHLTPAPPFRFDGARPPLRAPAPLMGEHTAQVMGEIRERPMKRLLIANRGEIAVRIARTAAEMGIWTLAVHSEDEAQSPHLAASDQAVALTGVGPAAYLDGDQIIAAALERGCEAVHPGYGFLAENAAFAATCEEAGLIFVGPTPGTLEALGDKTRALALARELEIPTLAASGVIDIAGARAFMASLGEGGAVMLKALAGGGGRGMRPVENPADLASAFERCASEAKAAFGDGRLFAEQFLHRARHVEVQIVGDGTGAVRHLGDRECSVQRQRQKVIETAPAASVDPAIRGAIAQAAVRLGEVVGYRGLGTVEFLAGAGADGPGFAFIEANPRLQVEHTVTEAVTGLDLVRLQLEIAAGRSLAELGIVQDRVPAPRGVAIECRINLETVGEDGSVRPAGGALTAYQPPSGPGVRVDGFAAAGYRTSARFDSLLAKLVVHAGDLEAAAHRADRALADFQIEGTATNIPLLRAILAHPDFIAGRVHTRFVEEEMGALAATARGEFAQAAIAGAQTDRRPGAKVDALDPLAVLAHGKTGALPSPPEKVREAPRPQAAPGPEGTIAVQAPIQGTVVAVCVGVGDAVGPGDEVLILESMKMEHVVVAPQSGYVRAVAVQTGDTLFEGHPLAFIEPAETGRGGGPAADAADLDAIRPDLAEVMDRQRRKLDEARPAAVERRRRTGQRTARENIDDLLDPGSFVEYGPLTVAARRRRHNLEDLIDQTPADGLVMGLGRINGAQFADEAARAAVMAYDYTVLAGTQGAYNHKKMDRLIEVAERWRLPTVFFCEGGGGRPGDTEGGGFIRGFEFWGRMSGLAPTIGITSGRCFAGNASVLGCCDVIIATKNANIGMGGPAMIEGGGLGVFRPEEIGPAGVQAPSGVIDVLVEDEAEAVAKARRYLSYFQGPLGEWACADQRRLRVAIPENRLRVYDIRSLIETLADAGSVLEIRPLFGATMVCALIRIEGRSLGLIANNPMVLGGAIDSDGSDKAARFLQICEAFDLPVLSLSDTPGMMVGPEVEKTALVRHCSRLFIIGANLTVPLFSVVLRKSYGLGAIAMTGGSYQASAFAVSWPTGEFGGMGLEGSVKLGYRNELAAIADPGARRARFDEMVAAAYEAGKALNRANTFGIDDVIDPADTRRSILAGLRSLPPPAPRTGKKLPWIDAW